MLSEEIIFRVADNKTNHCLRKGLKDTYDSTINVFRVGVHESSKGFVSLCGMRVNTENFDVALGNNPNKYRYIKIGNLRDVVKDCISDESLRCFIEDMKLGIGYVSLGDYLDFENVHSVSGKSVILNCTKSRNIETNAVNFKMTTDSVVRALNDMRGVLKETAVSLFGNFISENSNAECQKENSFYNNRDEKVWETKLNRACAKYISMGIPEMVVRALCSYGFANNRKKYYDKIMCVWNPGKLRYIDSLIYTEGMNGVPQEYLSDKDIEAYIERIPRGRVCIYNLIDLMRASGRDMQILFAAEVAKSYNNYALVDRIVNGLGIVELGELGVSKKEFTDYVLEYFKRISYLVDWGSTYTRNVRISQNNFVCFGVGMIENAGVVWEQVSKRVLKGFESNEEVSGV